MTPWDKITMNKINDIYFHLTANRILLFSFILFLLKHTCYNTGFHIQPLLSSVWPHLSKERLSNTASIIKNSPGCWPSPVAKSSYYTHFFLLHFLLHGVSTSSGEEQQTLFSLTPRVRNRRRRKTRHQKTQIGWPVKTKWISADVCPALLLSPLEMVCNQNIMEK